MAYDVTKLATLGQLGNLAERTVAAIAPTFKSLAVSGNRVNFYTSTDATGTVAAYVDFPEEIFLDQAGTTLVENFTWAAATYPGSTNPNLDGKTVLVLAVKGDAQTNPTTKYSFVDVSKLIDTYTAADNSITIAGYTVAVKINPSADNLLELTETGLMVDGSDILEKVDPATAGNVPLLASDGTLTNSTIVGADVITKVTGAAENNIVVFDATGKIKDGGHAIATDAEVSEYLQTILPTVASGNG